MKLVAVFILTVMLAPLSLPHTAVRHVAAGEESHFATLDVCHSGSPFVLAGADTAWLHESPCAQAPLKLAEFIETGRPFFETSLFSVRIEQPPRA